MNKFSDFGITPTAKGFEGEKIKVERILNKGIMVHSFKIEPSKVEGKKGSDCLHLQLTVDNEKRVLFSGSFTLIEMIKRVPEDKFPFETTIVKENDRLKFT